MERLTSKYEKIMAIITEPAAPQPTETDEPWIFIPMSSDDTLIIYAWIKRFFINPIADDQALAEQCNTAINKALVEHGLQFNINKYGEVKLETKKFISYSGSDGIAIPEVCFINPNSELERIKSPFTRKLSENLVPKNIR